MKRSELAKQIIDEADKCVKCALCSTHCPTYQISHNEAESPRGRIALMDGLASERITLTDKTHQHLKQCLTCRACETVCPAKVDYGKLIDLGRQWIAQRGASNTSSRIARAFMWIAQRRRCLSVSRYAIKLYQRSGLAFVLRKTGLLRVLGLQRLANIIPKQTTGKTSFHEHYHAKHSTGSVGLLLGCATHLFQAQSLHNLIKLLNAMQLDVIIPKQQTCCGALHWHTGDVQRAHHMVTQNHNAFNRANVDAIIVSASGCALSFHDSERLHAQSESSDLAIGTTPPAFEACQFLSSQEAFHALPFSPLNKRIGIHIPCTQSHGLQQADALGQVISAIPDVTCVPITDYTQCCGSAGNHLLSHQAISDELGQTLAAHIDTLNLDILVTSNVGCLLQITRLRPDLEVIHPVDLLARQLKYSV